MDKISETREVSLYICRRHIGKHGDWRYEKGQREAESENRFTGNQYTKM